MRRFREIMERRLFPGWKWVVPLVLLSAGGLYLVFFRGLEGTAFAYVVYPVSFYALTAAAAGTVRSGRAAWRRLTAVPLVERWRRDDYFRVRVGLALSFQVNLCYAGLRIVCAVLYLLRVIWLSRVL